MSVQFDEALTGRESPASRLDEWSKSALNEAVDAGPDQVHALLQSRDDPAALVDNLAGAFEFPLLWLGSVKGSTERIDRSKREHAAMMSLAD